ncbi:MAG: Maf family protein [Desulfatiglans sp.]|jgi:septum formation protein|nr:Maf family protein [Thermodesulfobacteriota bacterium]MEE4353877.1 Maf family protein [Desulfatiglans sp.]
MRFHKISAQNPLVLASASPRRERLLSRIGLPFDSMASRINEEDIIGDPALGSRMLAMKKATDVYARIRPRWVMGADTIVVVNDEILGKPDDNKEARRMLGLLSGREHRVITGFCVLNPAGEVSHTEAVTTTVRIKGLSELEIEAYTNMDEPYDKAGGYAVQGMGSFMVKEVSGSYTNVVGLPLCEVIEALISAGAIERFPLPR